MDQNERQSSQLPCDVPPQTEHPGSLWAGFGMFWAYFCVWFSLAWTFIGPDGGANSRLPEALREWLLYGGMLLPLAFFILLLVVSRWRTALGVIIGYACVMALFAVVAFVFS
jgi:hypothetical protein